MRAVSIFSMPHNYRDELYDPGDGPSFCHYDEDEQRRPAPGSSYEWATLPVVMPESLMVTTDRTSRVIAASADGKRIRWADLDIVTKGVEEYNVDACRE